MIGLSIQSGIGIGDALQFSSLPENYFRTFGEKLVDVSRPWFFDDNPYVVRQDLAVPMKTFEPWNFGPKKFEWPRPRNGSYLSNAEIWATAIGAKVYLNRPRLYRHEGFKFKERKKILFQTDGRSHGRLPEHVIDHVLRKYSDEPIFHIGNVEHKTIGIPKLKTESLWDLAREISECRMIIGPDSGPSWIAACYPDVVVKKIRTVWQHGIRPVKDWIPLEIDNYHSHWDDRCFQIFNTEEEDVGFTYSYRKL